MSRPCVLTGRVEPFLAEGSLPRESARENRAIDTRRRADYPNYDIPGRILTGTDVV